MKKIIFAILSFCIVLFIALSSLDNREQFEYTEINKRSIVNYIELSGEAVSKDKYIVSAGKTGIISTICKERGERISNGEGIILLDSSLYAEKLSKLKIEEEKLINEMKNDETQDDNKNLAYLYSQTSSMDSKAFNDFINRLNKTNLYASEEYRELKTQEVELQTEIDSSIISSKKSGIIDEIFVLDGASVVSGQAIASIIDVNNMVIRVFANPDENINRNMKLIIKKKNSDKVILGNIGDIEQISDSNGNKLVKIDIECDEKLNNGEEYTVRIIKSNSLNVPCIPVSAVDADNCIYVLDAEGKITKQKIKTGICDGEYIEVITQLEPDIKVIKNADEVANYFEERYGNADRNKKSK